MKVRVIYDPILRTKVAPVTVFDSALKKEAEEMLKTMKSQAGIGLAANQVGLNKRLIVLGYEKQNKKDEIPNIPFMQLCNPEVVKESNDTEIMTEGCLSLPGLELPVERSRSVIVDAQTLDGKPVKIKAKGLLARVLLHEIDHLNGILFTDRAASLGDVKDYQFARIVFFGSDEFSAPVLEQLVDAGYGVLAVITETAKRAGRGNELVEPYIKEVAERLGIAVFQPESMDEIEYILGQIQPDVTILASYGKILSEKALSLPVYGSLNVHPSLLPKYRGATPIQSAILAGDKATGVTVMTMAPQVDAGALVAQEVLALTGQETASELKRQLAAMGAQLLVSNLRSYLAGQAKLQVQDPSAVTKTKKLTKDLGEINWEKPVEQLDREIRAFQGWPGSFTYLDGKRLKILEASLDGGKLSLKRVQLEGKNPTGWADFVRGYQDQLTKTPWYGKISQ